MAYEMRVSDWSSDVGSSDLRLMALAGDEHDVAGARLVDRGRDGGGTIGLDGAPGRGGHARPDGVDDGQRVLSSWVVGGQEYPIREARRHLAHLGPFGGIAIAAGAQDDQDPAAVGRVARDRKSTRLNSSH